MNPNNPYNPNQNDDLKNDSSTPKPSVEGTNSYNPQPNKEEVSQTDVPTSNPTNNFESNYGDLDEGLEPTTTTTTDSQSANPTEQTGDQKSTNTTNLPSMGTLNLPSLGSNEPKMAPNPFAKQEKKSKLPLIITIIVLALITIGVGVFFFIQNSTQSPEPQVENKTKVEDTKKQAKEENVDKSNRLPSSEVISKAKAILGTLAYKEFEPQDRRDYKVKDADFAVYLSDEEIKGYGFRTVLPANKYDLIAKLDNEMEKHLIFTKKNFVDSNTKQNSTYYDSQKAICRISYTKIEKKNDYGLSMWCGDTELYTQKAKELKPFYDAYVAKQGKPDDGTTLSLFPPTIKQSQTVGYQVADMALGMSNPFNSAIAVHRAIFYQGPDQVWKFYKNTQNSLNCDEFKNEELQKAFAGYECYTNGKSSNVKPQSTTKQNTKATTR